MTRRRSGGTKRERKSRRSFWFRVALQVAGVVIVIVFFFRERHLFFGFGSTMSRLTWIWVVVAFASEMASIPPLAEAQRTVLAVAGTEVPRWKMIQLTLASNAISMSVPAGVAVAEGYAYSKYRRFGATIAAAAWAELASGAIAFAALAALAFAGALIAGGNSEPILLAVLTPVLVGSVAAAALFRHPHVLVDAIGWVERHVGRRLGAVVARASTRVREISESLDDVHPSITRWAWAGALSGVNWLLDSVCLAVCFKAVGAPIPWGAVLLAFAGAKIVSSIGVTPAGLGFVEGGLVAIFVAYGTKGPSAVAAVVVYRAITFIGLVGIGWIVVGVLAVQTRRRAPRS
jgi:putative heme transporter